MTQPDIREGRLARGRSLLELRNVKGGDEYLAFEVADNRYGIWASDVSEILRAITIVPLPKAPQIVEGIITIRGNVVPVLDLRARFRLPAKAAAWSDRVIVARASGRRIAFRVDRTIDLLKVDPLDIEDASALVAGAEYVAGVAKLSDGLMLIHDLQTFLTAAEAASLTALAQEGSIS